MMNRHLDRITLGVVVLGLAAGLMLTGCSGEEEAPVVQNYTPPPAPPPPPPPALTTVEQLMADLNIDRRVMLPEDKAPGNDADRKAVLVFFDALARGNSQSLGGMLPLSDQIELNALVESGAWQDTVSKIQKVQVQTGTNSLNQKCALAVIEVGGGVGDVSFQPQLWYYSTEQEEPMFEAAPTPPGILDKLSGDWIASWHSIIQAELAMAERPDEDVSIPQQDLDESENESSSSGGGRGFGGGGEGGGGGPTIRDPSKTPPTRAPGPR